MPTGEDTTVKYTSLIIWHIITFVLPKINSRARYATAGSVLAGLTSGAARRIMYRMERKDAARARAGTIVSAAGVGCNLLLAAAKIAAGAVFGLVSVLADGFNNVSDCAAGAISMASFRIAEKPADEKHPYGHRRAENVASLIIGCLVLFLAVELFRESISKIIDGSVTEANWIVFLVLGLSVAVKGGMFLSYAIAAKKLQSDTLKAAAVDSACDCLATVAVIAGALAAEFLKLPADGWVGAAVALFIGWQGISILIEACSKLLGQAPEKELLNRIRTAILSGQGVLGMHDLRVYGYGRGKYFASVHVEMDAELPALASHAVVDGLEHKVLEELGVELTAHLDPVDLKDTEARELEKLVRCALAGLEEGLEVHDFRLVRGVKKKLIFDAAAPYACKLSDEALNKKICETVRGVCDCEPVVTVERE